MFDPSEFVLESRDCCEGPASRRGDRPCRLVQESRSVALASGGFQETLWQPTRPTEFTTEIRDVADGSASSTPCGYSTEGMLDYIVHSPCLLDCLVLLAAAPHPASTSS